MRLTVKQLKNRDPGSGMAVIDRKALQEIDVSSGDFVAIEGRDGGRTVARVWPSDTDDAGRGIIRIDGQLRQAANASIDDALLRPGRLDRHVAVGEPDEAARREIFEIHTRDKPLADDVDFDELVERTDGYVGADIEAVCREAATIAVREYVRATASGETASVDEIELAMSHFEQALEEVGSNVGPEPREFKEAPEAV